MDIGQCTSLTVTVLVEDSINYAFSNMRAVHGLSCLVEATKDNSCFRLLVDVGSDPDILLHNMACLGVDPSCIDAIMLTHCHWDHTGGLAKVVEAIGKKGLPVVAHPAIYRDVFVQEPHLRYSGVARADSQEEVERNGGALLLSKDPVKLAAGLATTGEIERFTDFEGSGGGVRIEAGTLVEDEMPDDLSLMAVVKNHGLVVISGCSHAGIVNIVRQASIMTGVEKASTVIGGLHLISADERKIERTVEGLVSMGVGRVAAGHCTGFDAQVALKRALGDRFTPMQCGCRYEFG